MKAKHHRDSQSDDGIGDTFVSNAKLADIRCLGSLDLVSIELDKSLSCGFDTQLPPFLSEAIQLTGPVIVGQFECQFSQLTRKDGI